MAKPDRDLEFLYEIGTLRNMQRGWRAHTDRDTASVLEHTMRVVWLALIIARREGVKDEEKIMKMAMVHDLAESRTSDLGYIQKVYVEADEDRAAGDTLAGTALADFYSDVLKEYKARKTKAAQIVKDADNLDYDLELKELEEFGSQLPAKSKKLRKLVRDQKLYTKTAKKIWDEIQRSDVSSWHLNGSKWHKIPKAGR